MNWFECKISYKEMNEMGRVKSVTRSYLVDAISHAEAEVQVVEEMKRDVRGEFTVLTVRKVKYAEMFLSEGGVWWKCRVDYFVQNNRTEQEWRTGMLILAEGDTVEEAICAVRSGMRRALCDYEITGISRVNYSDIILHEKTV